MTSLLSLLLFFNLQSFAKVTPQIYSFGEKTRLAEPEKNISIDLAMAKGEFENFTVALPSVNSSNLISKVQLNWKTKNPGVTLNTYKLFGHNFKSSSFKPRFKAGEVADIPVPLDWLTEKKITPPAFSTLSLSQFLFEIFVKTDATAGTYDADLTFVVNKDTVSIPVKIKIYNTVLPNKFDLKTSFGFAPWEVLLKHYGGWNKEELKLYDQYYAAALEHRIDLHKIYIKYAEKGVKDPLVEAPKGQLSFLNQTKPLWAGENHKNKYQMSVTDLPVPQEYKTLKVEAPRTLKDIETFWKNLNASVVKNNYKDRTFVYFVDEPTESQLKGIGEDLRQIKKWAPNLKFLVTSPYRPTLEGAVDIWVLNLFIWDRPDEKPPQFYKQRQVQNKEELWFYVGCNSHGCNEAEDVMNPDLVTDRPSAFARVFPWMALRYGATGILYYDTVYTYSHGGELSPWMDSFDFTGYGEGGLFYPCTAKLGQCKSPEVIPALRLKILRDGLEDVQIVKMAIDKGFDSQQVNKVVRDVRDFSVATAGYENVKRAALEFLDKPQQPAKK